MSNIIFANSGQNRITGYEISKGTRFYTFGTLLKYNAHLVNWKPAKTIMQFLLCSISLLIIQKKIRSKTLYSY